MQQAYLGQDLYPTSLVGAFELMVWHSGSYPSLGQRQGQRSGCCSHNGGRVNGGHCNNPHNCLVFFLQQVESNRTPVPGIDGTTIGAEFYYCHVTGCLSNNFPKVPFERHRNCGSDDRGSVELTGTRMCHICVGLFIVMMASYLLIGCCLIHVLPLFSVIFQISSIVFGNVYNMRYLLQ